MVIVTVLNRTPMKTIEVDGEHALFFASSMPHFFNTACQVLKANSAFCLISAEAKSS